MGEVLQEKAPQWETSSPIRNPPEVKLGDYEPNSTSGGRGARVKAQAILCHQGEWTPLNGCYRVGIKRARVSHSHGTEWQQRDSYFGIICPAKVKF